MIVAASTRCFNDLTLDQALARLVELEFTNVEILIHEKGGHLRPSEVCRDLDQAIQTCRQTRRLTPIAYSIDIDIPPERDEYYRQFEACCRLAKATKVVTLIVQSGELGTPFNAEVERLREIVRLATLEGIKVGLLTEVGRMTQDPDTAVVFCNSVKGLALALDPSHYVAGPHQGAGIDQIFEHVCHVRLRDTSKTQMQVRIGQGEVEYGRLVSQLIKSGYNRALCVDIVPMPDVEQAAELRKMRLLLESLL